MVVRDPRRASLTYVWPSCVGGAGADWRRTYRGAKSTDYVNRRRDRSFELRVRAGSWRPTRSRNYVRTYVCTYVVSCPGREPARPWEASEGSVPVDVLRSHVTSRQGTVVHGACGKRKCRKGHRTSTPVHRRVLVGGVCSDKTAGRQIARRGARVSGKATATAGTTPCVTSSHSWRHGGEQKRTYAPKSVGTRVGSDVRIELLCVQLLVPPSCSS